MQVDRILELVLELDSWNARNWVLFKMDQESNHAQNLCFYLLLIRNQCSKKQPRR